MIVGLKAVALMERRTAQPLDFRGEGEIALNCRRSPSSSRGREAKAQVTKFRTTKEHSRAS